MQISHSNTPTRGRKTFRLLPLVGHALLLAAVLTSTPAAAQHHRARVDSLFAFITPEAPGCAVGVSQHGEQVVDRVYGLADLARQTPLTPGTAFDIGSTQKQFVAAAVLLLVEDGRMALTDDIRTFLPELPVYGHTITVDHLLTHTSGVRDWTGLLPLAQEGSDVLDLILRQRGLNFAPGEAWSYSNSGYVLLKEIVARVSGMSFAAFAHQRLFAPLGMTSSAYVEDILQSTGAYALAYRREGDDWTPFMRLGNERGGGAVVSTASDLLAWNDALTTGRLGAFVTRKLEEPATLNNGRTLTYARGLNVDAIPGERLVSHSGSAAGYSTWLGRFTANALSVAVLCNFEPISATDLARRVSDLFLPPIDPDAEPPMPVAAEGVDVSGRAGLFFEEDTGKPLRLITRGDRLGIAGGPPLIPVSGERFRPQRATLFFWSEDAFELTFTSDDTFERTSMEGTVVRYRRAEPWAPTAADLAAFDGRYRGEDLGRDFEIVTGPDGMVWRYEDTPERAIELEPVAPDTYMQRLMVVRFERDASGRVTGFDYSNPVVQHLRFTRLGDRAASADAPPTEPPTSAAPPEAVPQQEGLVGAYEMAPGRTLTVTLEDGHLYGQPTGNPKRLLTHVSGTTFSVGDGRIAVTFALGPDGRATALVMNQNGRERTLPRVD